MKLKKHLNFTELRKKASEVFRGIPDPREVNKRKLSLHDVLMNGLYAFSRSIVIAISSSFERCAPAVQFADFIGSMNI